MDYKLFGMLLVPSDNAEDKNIRTVSTWECIIPWAVIYWLGDKWNVVMFTVLCYNANGSDSWWEIGI